MEMSVESSCENSYYWHAEFVAFFLLLLLWELSQFGSSSFSTMSNRVVVGYDNSTLFPRKSIGKCWPSWELFQNCILFLWSCACRKEPFHVFTYLGNFRFIVPSFWLYTSAWEHQCMGRNFISQNYNLLNWAQVLAEFSVCIWRLVYMPDHLDSLWNRSLSGRSTHTAQTRFGTFQCINIFLVLTNLFVMKVKKARLRIWALEWCYMQELLALLNAGPPPLGALALNRCDLTESSISALAAACPNLEVCTSSLLQVFDLFT